MGYPLRSFDYCKCVNVVDGDTLDIEVDMGFNNKTKQRFRLAGVDTPERGQPGWQEAKDFVAEFVKDRRLVIVSEKVDKYGRYLATVFDTDEVCLNEQLIGRGLAKVYA